MYGLEKKSREKFDFDLEVEIKKKPARKEEIVNKAKKQAEEIKKTLRQEQSENQENLGHILHGYTALQKVITKVSTS